MKIATWNVNGIRASSDKGLLAWAKDESPDLICLQEVKAFEGQVSPEIRSLGGEYHGHWRSAQKPGYSGVATFVKTSVGDPLSVSDMGIEAFDREGRVLVTEFKKFVLINAYFPNSQRERARLPYKLEFCAAMRKLCEGFRAKGKNVILCGDYNIAHREIDLKNPKQNVDNAGFLPEERAWMDEFTDQAGFVDVFRHFEKGPQHYTWWSYRPGIRERNIGWRIDYHSVNPEFIDAVKACDIRADIRGSDHCPVILTLKR